MVKTSSTERYSSSNKAHTESVLLLFWGNACTPRKKKADDHYVPLAWHWSEEPPNIREIEIACIGSPMTVKGEEIFEVHGVLPQSYMPKMGDGEQWAFMKALEHKLIKQMKMPIAGLAQRDVVDWEGSNPRC